MSEIQKTEITEQTFAENKVVIPVKRPITIDDKKIDQIVLDFDKMTGADILKIDNELRATGTGFDDLFNQRVVLKLAAYASGINELDLQRLHPGDFLEMQFVTRNFFIKW